MSGQQRGPAEVSEVPNSTTSELAPHWLKLVLELIDARSEEIQAFPDVERLIPEYIYRH
jgi:hypothetical protein